MTTHVLDELLATLDVRLHAFALCDIQRGHRLQFEAMDAVVVHYVLAGRGVVHQQDAAPVEFGPHSMLVVAPRKAQSLASEPVTRTVAADSPRLLADGLITFVARNGEGVDAVQGFDAEAGGLLVVCGTITATFGGRFGLFDRLLEPLVEDVRGDPAMHAAFDTLLRELSMPGVGSRALTEALMKQCLVLLLRNHLAREGSQTPLFAALVDPRLARALCAVLAKPGAPHTLQSLANEAGMSRSVFAERFVTAYGQSPFEFVQAARLDHAARLLRISDLPVKAIASAVGYASRSHFSRAFSASFGQDPTRYRKRSAPPDDANAASERV